MREHRFVFCDVFTRNRLEGNQLAVFTDGAAVPETAMQPLARELGFSETVFVLPGDDGCDARLRIFTPAAEIPFAGHPLLGTAAVLAGERAPASLRLLTGAGPVALALERAEGGAVLARMEQPLPRVAAMAHADELLAALGVERSELPVEVYDNGARHAYVALADEAAVAAVGPDLRALARVARLGPEPLLGTSCFAGAGRRWKTRMFAPADGVDEDPATGSAAGPLACHLARHGRIAFGEEIEISQGVELARPSTLYARADGTAERIERVEVSGHAVVVASGAFALDG